MIVSVEEAPKSKYPSPPKCSTILAEAVIAGTRRYAAFAIGLRSPVALTESSTIQLETWLDMISSPPDAFSDLPKSKSQRTPLPVDQITILLFLRFCEAASMYVIFPFLNEVRAREQTSYPTTCLTSTK